MGALSPIHKLDYKNTQPPASIPPNLAWLYKTKIMSLDPWGHLVSTVFREETQEGRDVRPSIAVTKAHLKMSELDDAARRGALQVDGVLVLSSRPGLNTDGSMSSEEPGVEANVSKAAVEPVWYLSGGAEMFGM